MKKFICLQAGHEGTTTGATGAPGEKDFNIRVRNRLGELLIQNGFMVQLVDANFDKSPEITKDFDLFLAIHYDANIYGTGGGFVDWIDPSIDSSIESNNESKRIKQAIESVYFTETGIVNHPERTNANTKFYYMWDVLSAKTPCVIIECGVGKDAHDNVILNDTNRVANAIAKGIKKAFPSIVVTPPTPTPPTVDPCLSIKLELEASKKEVIKLQKEMTGKLAIANESANKKIQDFKTKIINLVNSYV